MLARQVMSQLELRRAIAERDERLEASHRVEQRQSLLVRELHHRVKNTLATVQALVGATGRSSGSFDEFYRSFSKRIASLAKTHNLLTEDYWQTAPLREIALKELKPFAESRQPRFMLLGPRSSFRLIWRCRSVWPCMNSPRMPSAMGLFRFPLDTFRFRWSVHEDEGVRSSIWNGGSSVDLPWLNPSTKASARPCFSGFCPCSAMPRWRSGTTGGYESFQMDTPLIKQRLVPDY